MYDSMILDVVRQLMPQSQAAVIYLSLPGNEKSKRMSALGLGGYVHCP